jgi:hypothetical protein
MQTGYISFCDKIGFNIKTQNVKENILKEIYNISNIKIIQKHFEILKHNHFNKLNDNPHLISLKSNGNPYLLYLTSYNFINTSIFIDKKIQAGYFLPRMIISRFNFPDELFDNTLIEGEMIKNNNNKWIFLINDIYIHKGISLNNKNLMKRLDILKNIFNNYQNDIDDVCLFQINKYFTYDKFNYLINDYKNSLNYSSRGIYFKPLYFKFKNILYNFDDSLICKVQKIKYQKNNEFISNNKLINKNNITSSKTSEISIKSSSNNSFKILYIENTDLPDVYNLYNFDNTINNLKSTNQIAYIPNIESSNFTKNLFTHKPINTKIKVKCILNQKFNKWTPIQLIE